MRIMTRQQSEILDRLVQLANGNSLLVERAINVVAARKPTPTLDDIIAYIEAHRTRDRVARRSRSAEDLAHTHDAA